MTAPFYATKNKIDRNILRQFKIEASRCLQKSREQNPLYPPVLCATLIAASYQNQLPFWVSGALFVSSSLFAIYGSVRQKQNNIVQKRKLNSLIQANRETIRTARARTMAAKTL